MPNWNDVNLIGHLTRDPQLKFLPSNTPVVEFGLATSQKFKGKDGEDKEDVVFIDICAFGKPAEIINQYCKKGSPIFVNGRLKYEQWEKDGQKRSKHSVVCENFQLLRGKNDGAGDDRNDDLPT